ncbi:MAG TPA: MarR family winged helix-turn-helix transcriptional regulator [bacterium]|nr:MarR family winged helix-turn-helix transcriptional regulator [bacterium]HQI49992.1 MarR family winged helix-turn-helix transcriptional regulator [bacterium]HQJ65638.1 MarR family winged helix-turn-helix transcriptional regulator [bacterium]
MSSKSLSALDQARRLAVLAPRIMGAFHSLNRQHPVGTPVTMRQYQTLILLSVHEPLTVTELCDKLMLAASTGTELVNRLLQLQLVEKHTAETDRRQVGIRLTETGREVMEQRQRDMVAMFEHLLAEFGPAEAAELMAAFEKIDGLLQAHLHPSQQPQAPPAPGQKADV